MSMRYVATTLRWHHYDGGASSSEDAPSFYDRENDVAICGRVLRCLTLITQLRRQGAPDIPIPERWPR